MDHQKLLTDLPSVIIITILCRLPPKTIISCKCVCKLLFNLLETPDFVKFHLSKSIPGLIVYNENTFCNSFKIFEFKDELNLEEHELRSVPVAQFACSEVINPQLSYMSIEGSANGLLCLRDLYKFYICNPITREYVNLPNLELRFRHHNAATYGFGVSKKADQYKVVSIFQDFELEPITNSLLSILKSECRVYTLGTGTWRSVPHNCSLRYSCYSKGVCLNDNLHWSVLDLKRSLLISCFDLETELFKVFSPPPYFHEERRGRYYCIVVTVLEDFLCLCDTTSYNEITIWVMKEYGVEKSWTKEIVINRLSGQFGVSLNGFYPIKVFGDGDVLLLLERYQFGYYSNKTKTTSNIEMFKQEQDPLFEARLHVSSFLSIKNFGNENVAKF